FPVGDFTEDKWRQYEWAYYRLIEKADEQIGVVLNALRAAGKADDTVIVLLSDHGDCQGAHGWNQKTVFYEEATRVPFIVSWPSYIRQGRSERLVNTGIDLIPTLCDVAGIRPPAHLPGESVIDNLPTERKFVVSANRFIQGASVDGNVPTATGRMLRSTRYKYCVYSEGGSRESLVDLQNDPGEMVNLVGNERFEGVLKDHRKMLQEWCRKTSDTFAFV
ncbi:MAG TPA: sulfatase/phosphatase domain-containing protein, partial [Edaphobacter sp.]|nr:sulfatase/phosphatase domain-containing protein [Edaphobacter sp.]